MAKSFDIVIIGAGIIGLSLGYEIKRKYPRSSVLIMDKEQRVGAHASTRNSGVIHAGIYYEPNSLKARLARDGNFLLTKYLTEMNLPIHSSGKVIVARNHQELSALNELWIRGTKNGVPLRQLDVSELNRFEPLARTFENAIWSPTTAVSDPMSLIESIKGQFESMGGKLILGAKVTDISDSKIITTYGEFSYGHVVNASGLYADKIAKLMGFSKNHDLIPFAGVYYDVPELKGKLSRQIYPVPDLRLPFLGVHFTAGFGGDVKLGPSAIPLLSRQQYSTFKGWDAREFFEISQNLWRFFLHPSNKALALAKSEIMHLSKNRIMFEAQKLLKSTVKIGNIKRKTSIGIRAQLISKMNGRLEQDFLIEGDFRSTHILNAVSPGWTSCFSFAKHVLSILEEKVQF